MTWKIADFDGVWRRPFDEHFDKIMETVMSNSQKIYLSGKMQGLPENNFPKFAQHAKLLRNLGFTVVNPAENPPRANWEEYMKLDITNMVECDTVAVLDDWKDSRGARIEVKLAKQLGLRIIWAHNLKEVEFTETVLEEADRLVNGDRQQAYGHPYDDYKCVSGMFNCYLQKKYGYDFEKFKGLDVSDTIIHMQLVKISREANAPKRDNMVDLAGYAQCLYMVREREAAEAKKSQAKVLSTAPSSSDPKQKVLGESVEKKSVGLTSSQIGAIKLNFSPDPQLSKSIAIVKDESSSSAKAKADAALADYKKEIQGHILDAWWTKRE